jgi:hypothetical protein
MASRPGDVFSTVGGLLFQAVVRAGLATVGGLQDKRELLSLHPATTGHGSGYLHNLTHHSYVKLRVFCIRERSKQCGTGPLRG